MSLGQSLLNALRIRLVIKTFFQVIIFVLERATSNALSNFHRNGKLKPFSLFEFEFKNFETLVFTSYVARAFREFLVDSISEYNYVFLRDENNRGERIIHRWENVAVWLLRKLKDSGYSNIDRAFDYIVLAVMCLAYWYKGNIAASDLDQQLIGVSFISLLQLALEALSSVPQPEAEAHGEGSGEPQPEAEAHGEGSGEPQPEAEAHGEGSGEPQPEAEAHGEGSGEGSGEPQPEEGSVDVPLDAGTVRGVRRYRLRDTLEREISRQRRARSRYNLRETPARQER